MQVLLHVGLNKCASSYVQAALQDARTVLAGRGVFVPEGGGHDAQYGLSRHYGFGPVAEDVAPVAVAPLCAAARQAGAGRMILSSEYLSLHNPGGIDRLLGDLDACGAQARVVVLGREVRAWLRALFNQYVKSVEGGPVLTGLDAFAAQVLGNRALDPERRLGQWMARVPEGRLDLYRMTEGAPADAVLAPFERFAGGPIAPPPRVAWNRGLDPDRLHAIGQLRAAPPSRARDRQIARLVSGAPAPGPAPAGYMTLGPALGARIAREVATPMEALPWQRLTPVEPALS